MKTNSVTTTFVAAAREALQFLGEFGFVEVEAGSTIVRLISENVTLTMYHGRSSGEIGIEIGMNVPSAPLFSLSEVIRLADETEGERFRNPASTTRDGVRRDVHAVGSLLRKYGESMLKGDPSSFTRLVEQRERWATSYSLDVLATQLRPQANDAFRDGRYSEALYLFERIKSRLSSSELKKMELAGRRAGKA